MAGPTPDQLAELEGTASPPWLQRRYRKTEEPRTFPTETPDKLVEEIHAENRNAQGLVDEIRAERAAAPSRPGTLEAVGRAGARGLTFDFEDEAQGVLNTLNPAEVYR